MEEILLFHSDKNVVIETMGNRYDNLFETCDKLGKLYYKFGEKLNLDGHFNHTYIF